MSVEFRAITLTLSSLGSTDERARRTPTPGNGVGVRRKWRLIGYCDTRFQRYFTRNLL
jgi:hypothetical protein